MVRGRASSQRGRKAPSRSIEEVLGRQLSVEENGEQMDPAHRKALDVYLKNSYVKDSLRASSENADPAEIFTERWGKDAPIPGDVSKETLALLKSLARLTRREPIALNIGREDLVIWLVGMFSKNTSPFGSIQFKGAVRLQKLIYFLTKQRISLPHAALFSFQPYRYGMFAKDIPSTIRTLEQASVLGSRNKSITDEGEQSDETSRTFYVRPAQIVRFREVDHIIREQAGADYESLVNLVEYLYKQRTEILGEASKYDQLYSQWQIILMAVAKEMAETIMHDLPSNVFDPSVKAALRQYFLNKAYYGLVQSGVWGGPLVIDSEDKLLHAIRQYSSPSCILFDNFYCFEGAGLLTNYVAQVPLVTQDDFLVERLADSLELNLAQCGKVVICKDGIARVLVSRVLGRLAVSTSFLDASTIRYPVVIPLPGAERSTEVAIVTDVIAAGEEVLRVIQAEGLSSGPVRVIPLLDRELGAGAIFKGLNPACRIVPILPWDKYLDIVLRGFEYPWMK
jgi:hypothetical protein